MTNSKYAPYDDADYYHQKVTEGWTVGEIARDVDVGPGTVRKRMEKYGVDPFDPVEHVALRDPEYLRIRHVEHGWPAFEIADEVGCSAHNVRKWLKRHGIEVHRPGWKPDLGSSRRDFDVDEMARLYVEGGLTLQEVADEIDCGEETVRLRLEERDVERRSSGNRPGAEHPMWKGGTPDYYGESWHRQRQAALDRDGRECRACEMGVDEHRDRFGQGLHVHHITPFRVYDDHEEANDLLNLVTLCRACHARWEGVPLAPEGTER